MEFDEMKVIWDNQNNEKLYAVNEDALYTQIKNKGRSVNRLMNFVEMMMIAVNFGVGLVLFADAWTDGGSEFRYVMPILYILFSFYGLYRRITRRQEEVRFDQTIIGELDKAIWQIDYLIAQGRSIIFWYVLPLALAFSVVMILDGKLLWAIGISAMLFFASYFGAGWETRKWYLPKKKDLESLREMLLAVPS